MSRPCSMLGMACTWTGDGSSYPISSSARRIGSAIPSPSNPAILHLPVAIFSPVQDLSQPSDVVSVEWYRSEGPGLIRGGRTSIAALPRSPSDHSTDPRLELASAVVGDLVKYASLVVRDDQALVGRLDHPDRAAPSATIGKLPTHGEVLGRNGTAAGEVDPEDFRRGWWLTVPGSMLRDEEIRRILRGERRARVEGQAQWGGVSLDANRRRGDSRAIGTGILWRR